MTEKKYGGKRFVEVIRKYLLDSLVLCPTSLKYGDNEEKNLNQLVCHQNIMML
jgi:hypothetical protein